VVVLLPHVNLRYGSSNAWLNELKKGGIHLFGSIIQFIIKLPNEQPDDRADNKMGIYFGGDRIVPFGQKIERQVFFT
jgi:hypothetical protein